MLKRLDKELENILPINMRTQGFLPISTIREKGIVDVEFIQSATYNMHYQHLWTENNINFCDNKWKFILTMWSDKPLKTMELWKFIKECQSPISSLIRQLSERKGAFKDETYDTSIEYITELELRKEMCYDDSGRD